MTAAIERFLAMMRRLGRALPLQIRVCTIANKIHIIWRRLVIESAATELGQAPQFVKKTAEGFRGVAGRLHSLKAADPPQGGLKLKMADSCIAFVFDCEPSLWV
ncbi:hypothetical protein AK812_SmicGene21169 [Symbiodinium microadriaticum]|uniref:Uncharacterized protein n=1 Tax=Symbiodinium microadriaticum TaxID=2951 RepID=A0A1Q9DN36_SYMMI|nr:hypothetical protein AK812_SmicGene21169 [Symbiodinium microadriaticum]